MFARTNSAAEVVVFERSTFLVISRSTAKNLLSPNGGTENKGPVEYTSSDEDNDELLGFPPSSDKESSSQLSPGRFGKISQMVKSLRLVCS